MDRFIWTHRTHKNNFVCETYCSKVIGQNVKFLVIAPLLGPLIMVNLVMSDIFNADNNSKTFSTHQIQNVIKKGGNFTSLE